MLDPGDFFSSFLKTCDSTNNGDGWTSAILNPVFCSSSLSLKNCNYVVMPTSLFLEELDVGMSLLYSHCDCGVFSVLKLYCTCTSTSALKFHVSTSSGISL